MKCPNCGSPLGLEDKFCPYCGSPNKLATKHQRDMDRFDAEYQSTKDRVFRRTEVLRNHGGLLIILVLVLIALIGAVILNAYAWDISFRLRDRNSDKYATIDKEVMEEYLAAGEYGKFVGYVSSNDVSYEVEGDYWPIRTASRSYTALFEYISAIDNPSDYLFTDREMSYGCGRIAEDLLTIYNVEKENDSYYKEYFTEDKLAYIRDIQERTTLIAKTYFGLTDEEIEEIPNMSKSKLAAIIEEGLGR